MLSINRISSPMILIGTTTTIILLLLQSLISTVHGHSTRRSPISYISLVENPVIHTPSQRIHAYSEFSITFTLHRGKQEVRLSLEPNHDIVPKGAKVEYLDENGKVARTETIQRHEVKVFKGQSWVRDKTGEGWTQAGWARIMVKGDGVSPLFTGAFVLDHDAHHIQLRSWYLKTRHVEDPDLTDSGDEHMVVFRDSDVRQQSSLGGRSADKRSQCNTNNLPYNMHPEGAIYQNFNYLDTTPNPFVGRRGGLFGGFGLENLFSKLDKRQRVDDGFGGGNSGGVNLRNNIGQTNGCPITKQLALVGVAADCTYRSEFADEGATRTHIIGQFNAASTIFEATFNISLGIQNIVVQEPACPRNAPSGAPWNLPCTASNIVINDRLSLFSQWRGTRSNDGNAFWTLLTTCETGSAVGLAWVGMLCKSTAEEGQNGQFVSSTNVVAKTDTEWKVIAHEIGHTMGAVHDCTDEECAANMDSPSLCCPLSSVSCDAQGNFLMNPSTGDRIERFSPCTVGNICGAFLTRSVSKTCLTNNRDVEIITENRCGNGIVELGEECDCGDAENCAGNTCCDQQTCKFTTGSVCDDSNDDCCTKCQYSPATTVCRQSTGECDPEERCTGSSPNCPKDIVKPDGTGCASGLKCASGQCTSRDLQCQVIMGETRGDNRTSSCNQDSCQIRCSSPELGRGYCYSMQQNFLDGTPCEGDGKCRNGFCRGNTTLGAIREWINKNKPLVIGLASGIGGLLVFCFLVCIFNACRRRRRIKKLPPPTLAPPPVATSRSSSHHHRQHPPHSSFIRQGSGAGYVPPQQYSTRSQPPQFYGGSGGGGGGGGTTGAGGGQGPFFPRHLSERYG